MGEGRPGAPAARLREDATAGGERGEVKAGGGAVPGRPGGLLPDVKGN